MLGVLLFSTCSPRSSINSFRVTPVLRPQLGFTACAQGAAHSHCMRDLLDLNSPPSFMDLFLSRNHWAGSLLMTASGLCITKKTKSYQDSSEQNSS